MTLIIYDSISLSLCAQPDAVIRKCNAHAALITTATGSLVADFRGQQHCHHFD